MLNERRGSKLFGRRIRLTLTLVDGTITTQPEYAFWFADVGWKIENHGIDPDIEVEIAPQMGDATDPQLERAISEALRLIEERPGLAPMPGDKPDLRRRMQLPES